ncbi:MAG: CRISPR-associated helicase Cas3', partial [Minisyncoccales bacterium]
MENILKSHKNKKLKKHLSNVGEGSKEIILNKSLDLSLINTKQLADISYLIGISHDFGKASEFFQEYLKGNGKILREDRQHSLISAFFGYFIIKEYCKKENLNKIFSYIGAFLIRRHHGNLNEMQKSFEIDDKEKLEDEILKKQKESIEKNKEILGIYETFLEGYGLNVKKILENFFNEEIDYSFCRKKNENIEDCIGELGNERERIELFLITELLFSVLVDCDKKDAANLLDINNINEIKSLSIPEDSVENYIEIQKNKSPEKFNPSNEKDKKIVELKNQFFDYCSNNPSLEASRKIYSVTAPTGIGKTYASLATALKLKKKIKNNESKDFKINYVLPFTTIIDQNYKEFYNVLKEFCSNFDNQENDYILKHHYLTDQENLKKQTFEKKRETGEIHTSDYFDNLLFVKSWDSKLVVSSYVQLLETIIGGKNSFMNKFHNIVNSIIILDEVQCISLEYWELVKKIFKELAERFNVYFIFLTATQPMIFSEEKGEIIELSNKDLFGEEVFNRVKINKEIENKNEKSVEELYEMFKEKFDENKKRYLFVLNTKKSSLKLYSLFEKEIEKYHGKGYEIFYLSTNLTPTDRKEKLQKILGKKNESNEWEIEPASKFIIITTQLIEAGVDISSDICFRDISPIDSIIQTAGRVNRFGECESKGELNLIKIYEEKEEGKRHYPSNIYGNELLKWTEEIFEKNICEYSKDFLYLCDKFYSLFISDDGKTKKHSDSLINNLKDLNFEYILNNFKFIKSHPTQTVFILNEKSKDLIDKYKEIYNNKPQTKDNWSPEMKNWKGKLKKIR